MQSQYGLTVAETKKEESPLDESDTPFEVDECLDFPFHLKIISEDGDNWFNYNLLFFSQQSIKVLDTLFPETFAKCSETENSNCRNEPQDGSDLETELNLIADPEFNQMPIWSILTDKLEYPDHTEKHPICCHKAINKTKKLKQNTNSKTEFYEKYYFLEEKEQSLKSQKHNLTQKHKMN